ncbi:MAG TPA: hypothetical protein DIU07_05485 [Rhodobacteraceae bacterium]|nr:hypothetical protein [Paracoccaceae bacterium]
MFVRNIGCIGPDGFSAALDDVVHIVGRNNSGKSTLLRAYELAQGSEKFDLSRDRFAIAPEDQPSEVVLEIHIPEGIGNINEEWKEERDGLRILTSRWQWWPQHVGDGKLFPIRQTRRPGQDEEENEGFAEDGKAGGADNVFKSRLPQPVRIGSSGDPVEAEKALMKLVLEPVGTALWTAAADANTALAQAVAQLADGVTGIVQEQKAQFSEAVSEVEQGFTSVFPGLSVKLDLQAWRDARMRRRCIRHWAPAATPRKGCRA